MHHIEDMVAALRRKSRKRALEAGAAAIAEL
jgi:hypothetical protein